MREYAQIMPKDRQNKVGIKNAFFKTRQRLNNDVTCLQVLTFRY